jgi:hypothetical protein
MKLNPWGLGLAGGILWALALFIVTWISLFTGYGSLWLTLMMDIYPGFDVSVVGSFIGLAYGFIDGFVGLFLVAWLYNRFTSV